MITCPHCGKQLEDNVAFCIFCKERIGRYAGAGAAGAVGAGEASQLVDDAASFEESATPLEEPLADYGDAAAPAEGYGYASDAIPEREPVAYSEEDYANEAVAPTGEDYAKAAAAAGTGAATTAVMPAAETADPFATTYQNEQLHPEDSFEQRMSQHEERRSGGKVIAGALIALLAAVGIGVGGMMMSGNNLFGGGGDTSSSSTEVSSAAGSDSSSSKADSSSSSSESESSSTKTKRGATLSQATSEDEQGGSAEGSGEASGEGSGDSAGGGEGSGGGEASGGDSGAGGATYTDGGSGGGSGDSGSGGGSWGAFAPASATATSISPTEGSTPHGPDLVLDGIYETAWNTNESGIGQSITINAGGTGSLAGIRMMGGYNKISWRGEDLYYANARPQEILVEYEGGSAWFTLSDSKGTFQDLWFDGTVNTSWVKITIQSVYPGNAYDDCCISEIQML